MTGRWISGPPPDRQRAICVIASENGGHNTGIYRRKDSSLIVDGANGSGCCQQQNLGMVRLCIAHWSDPPPPLYTPEGPTEYPANNPTFPNIARHAMPPYEGVLYRDEGEFKIIWDGKNMRSMLTDDFNNEFISCVATQS